MAGSEQEGVDGATATMFIDTNWVLTPTELTEDQEFAIIREVVTSGSRSSNPFTRAPRCLSRNRISCPSFDCSNFNGSCFRPI